VAVWIIGGIWLVIMTAAFLARQVTQFRPPPATTAAEQQRVRTLIESLERPMERLAPAQAPAFSKLGGAPELPPHLSWPTGPDGPFAFVAQLDLADVRAAGGPEWLPAAGALFCFFDDQLDRMVVLFADRGGERPSKPPAPLEPEREFWERRVSFTSTIARPTIWWLDLHPLLLPAVEDLYNAHAPDHRVGGYPAELQSECLPVRCEGEAARRGFDPAQTDWRLLLQVDADDELGMVWVDEGRIYVLIREEDARAGDFSKTVTALHFH